ncbi:MAG: caspase family protein [Vicinamibacterales bacterium]
MLRAGLFIGVDRTGGLPRLKDAAAGAQRMHAWALSQGLVDGTQARLLTDANGGKVTSDQVYDAVQALIGGAGVEQLVVYFAGHGVNINRGEQWLLSDAPVRTSAAVDVSNSAKLARYSGVSHVVFLSDACRVAPDSIQAQNVRGIDIFPNDDASDRARPVDEFYACRLGRTAAEVRDAAAAAGAFRAVYTGALFEALAGQHAALLKPGDAGDPARYVWPVPLQDWLEAELPRRIRALSLSTPVIQDPDAVLSAEGQWLAQLAPSQIVPAPPPMPAASPGPSSRSRGTTRGVGSRPPASSGPGRGRRRLRWRADRRGCHARRGAGSARRAHGPRGQRARRGWRHRRGRDVAAMVDEVRTPLARSPRDGVRHQGAWRGGGAGGASR